MTDQALKKELNHYFEQMSLEQKKSILSVMKSFLEKKKTSKRVSVNQYNKELSEAEERIAKGEYTVHEDLVKQSQKW